MMMAPNFARSILLESESTANIIINPDLVKNIHQTNVRYINIHCNSGMHRLTKEATLKGYATVWFYKGAIPNIHHFHHLQQRFLVQYDFDEDVVSIQKPKKALYFHLGELGLYYHNTANRSVVTLNKFVKNREGYTQCQYNGAVCDCHTHGIL